MEQRYGCKGKSAWRTNLFQLSTSHQGLDEFSIRRFARLTGNIIHPRTPCVQSTDIENARVLHSSSSGTTSDWVSRLWSWRLCKYIGDGSLQVRTAASHSWDRSTIAGLAAVGPRGCREVLHSICVLIIDLSLSHEMSTKRTVSEYQKYPEVDHWAFS